MTARYMGTRFFASALLSACTLVSLACSDAPALRDAVPEMTFTVDPERVVFIQFDYIVPQVSYSTTSGLLNPQSVRLPFLDPK